MDRLEELLVVLDALLVQYRIVAGTFRLALSALPAVAVVVVFTSFGVLARTAGGGAGSRGAARYCTAASSSSSSGGSSSSRFALVVVLLCCSGLPIAGLLVVMLF